MAQNKFIGWSQIDLETWLRSIQEARMTGRVTRVTTAPGVYTEFDPQHDSVNLDQILDDLQYALWLLDPVTYTNPKEQRPGFTTQVFS